LEGEFNKQDSFTGLKTPPLTAAGIRKAISVERTLRARGVGCDIAFTSKLKYAQQNSFPILKELHAASTPVFETLRSTNRTMANWFG
jgi:2,3-bisphosphoglycerate-dependent phosphoglycerate mutase